MKLFLVIVSLNGSPNDGEFDVLSEVWPKPRSQVCSLLFVLFLIILFFKKFQFIFNNKQQQQ